MIPNFRISKYFWFKELTGSNYFPDLVEENELLAVPIIPDMVDFNREIADCAREAVGMPIIATSGFRGPELNKAADGAENSQHTRGLAVDLFRPEWRWDMLHSEIAPKILAAFKLKGIKAKVIIERKGGHTWIHISRFTELQYWDGIDGVYTQLAI